MRTRVGLMIAWFVRNHHSMTANPQAPGTGPVVVALGGNTLLGSDGDWTFEAQRTAIERTAARIARGVDAGHDLVLTHGNGPQVGNLLLEQDHVAETPRRPLDVLVAETQAQIGYLLQQRLDDALDGRPDFLTIVTQTVVDPDDPAFEESTKPIGPYYTAAEAAETDFETRAVRDDEPRYRRVVPSPAPIDVIEADEIARLVAAGNLVICAGGGGVPVTRGPLTGIEAVVDKDATAALLAGELGAERLIVLTDVPYVYRRYGKPDQEPIREPTVEELRALLDDGAFPPGSMNPKVQACLDFIANGGDVAVITEPERFEDALEGTDGTVVRSGA